MIHGRARLIGKKSQHNQLLEKAHKLLYIKILSVQKNRHRRFVHNDISRKNNKLEK
jgi:hypothetical protein